MSHDSHQDENERLLAGSLPDNPKADSYQMGVTTPEPVIVCLEDVEEKMVV